jgi:2-keto-4-pentenoate hydratase/2-oxohepta-3-ene-1,7-dioic acid hydratase in catechol pathway
VALIENYHYNRRKNKELLFMIYGIGRNYAKHALELGNELPKGNPIVFFKPDASVVLSGGTVKLPSFSSDVHFEGEVAFRFGPNLEIADFTVANDLTARDKQKEAQDTKSPWGLAKGFKQSTGLGKWIPIGSHNLKNLEILVTLNDREVQRGFTRDMIFDFKLLKEFLIANFPVQPGDVVLTGTPEGVGRVKSGDHLRAEIVGLVAAEWFYE